MASVRSGRDFEGPTRPPSLAEPEYKQEPRRRRARKQPPQRNIDEFWIKFNTKTPGKAFTILPDNLYAKRRAAHAPKGEIGGTKAIDSYDEAVRICKTKVEKIIRECRRVNQKYRDPHFDIELDFNRCQGPKWLRPSDCLMGLLDSEHERNLQPQAVKRVEVRELLQVSEAKLTYDCRTSSSNPSSIFSAPRRMMFDKGTMATAGSCRRSPP